MNTLLTRGLYRLSSYRAAESDRRFISCSLFIGETCLHVTSWCVLRADRTACCNARRGSCISAVDMLASLRRCAPGWPIGSMDLELRILNAAIATGDMRRIARPKNLRHRACSRDATMDCRRAH
jgi:hypothetical protein